MSTTRVRGLAAWSPRPATQLLLDQVRSLLAEYQKHLPLTIRQVFYRLVGGYDFKKTEHGYKCLCEHLNHARRAGMIPWEALRDDGITKQVHSGWDSADQYVAACVQGATTFTLDRQIGQPRRLVFAVEASGMVPQIARIAAPYGIDVHSAGGFDSTTAKYELAKLLGGYDATEVLHIGDHDPSGVHLFYSLDEDVRQIARDLGLAGDIRFTRLVVTPDQIVAYGLPTAPPKMTDNREFTGETTQAEALPPDVLADIVREAILRRVNHQVYRKVLAAEMNERKDILRHFRL